MGPGVAVTAWLMQRSARYAVGHGRGLDFTADAGTVLPRVQRVDVPTRHGRVRCTVQRPPVGVATGPPPLVVHLHGGAFIVRHPQKDDFYTGLLAAEVGAAVVSVDYDVAPRHAYPVAQHEAHDVALWFAAHGHELGLDGSRLALSGFSAGGNLAASASLQARDTGSFVPAYVVLVVPSLDVHEPGSAKRSTVAHPMVDARLLDLVRTTYFRDVSRRAEPYASPLLARSLAGLSPTLVITAEHDTLRSEGDVYAARLGDEGVDVTHHVVPHRDHAVMVAQDRTQARWVLDLVVARLGDALGTSTDVFGS
ncbi:MAG: alpha/beta hydrolase [Actinomycetota bacterium]|nr:alpha/beta hydrolase [Actinomycetota bacterium]